MFGIDMFDMYVLICINIFGYIMLYVWNLGITQNLPHIQWLI